jgi:hypothetical protein
MDNEVRDAIALRLQTDRKLLKMLPANVNFAATKKDDKNPRWSIVPISKFNPQAMMPQITIQLGSDTLMGTNLLETLIYIRCYNSSNKTHVEITDVLARVKELLHRAPLRLTGSTSIELVYETTQAEMNDQGYGDIPFRESRYRWTRV